MDTVSVASLLAVGYVELIGLGPTASRMRTKKVTSITLQDYPSANLRVLLYLTYSDFPITRRMQPARQTDSHYFSTIKFKALQLVGSCITIKTNNN